MKKNGCYGLDELLAAQEPQDDAVGEHLSRCARCRSTLASFHLFEDAGELPDGADRADASARLGAFLEDKLERVDRDPAAKGPGSMRLLRLPLSVGALAIAAALVTVMVLRVDDVSRRDLILRDANPADGPPRAELVVGPGSVLQWSWDPVAGADAYAIVFFDDEFVEIGRQSAVAPEDGRPSLESEAPAAAVLWRLVALRGGDEIARSAPEYLPENR